MRVHPARERENSMAEPAYPSLDEGGKIGFEGIAADEGDKAGSFSVQFTPSSGEAAKQQLTEETQPSYKTFEGGEQPIQASSEEINLLEKGTPSDKEKVRGENSTRSSACVQARLHLQGASVLQQNAAGFVARSSVHVATACFF